MARGQERGPHQPHFLSPVGSVGGVQGPLCVLGGVTSRAGPAQADEMLVSLERLLSTPEDRTRGMQVCSKAGNVA